MMRLLLIQPARRRRPQWQEMVRVVRVNWFGGPGWRCAGSRRKPCLVRVVRVVRVEKKRVNFSRKACNRGSGVFDDPDHPGHPDHPGKSAIFYAWLPGPSTQTRQTTPDHLAHGVLLSTDSMSSSLLPQSKVILVCSLN